MVCAEGEEGDHGVSRWMFDGKDMERISEYKYVGVLVNEKWSWDSHIDSTMPELHALLLLTLRTLSTYATIPTQDPKKGSYSKTTLLPRILILITPLPSTLSLLH